MQEKHTYEVNGMHCASCSAVIKHSLSKLPGVESCEVSYATEKATVLHDPARTSIPDMNAAIEKLGYSLAEKNSHQVHGHKQHSEYEHAEHLGLHDSKAEKLAALQEQYNAVVFALPLTVVIFILMLWDVGAQLVTAWPPMPVPMELFNPMQAIIASVVLFWIGRPFIEGAVRFFKYRVANMDSLIGIGTLVAYVYSLFVLLFPSAAQLLELPTYTYFDVTIVVIGFVTLGKYLEARSKIKTGQAIEKLLALQAKTATIIRNGAELIVPIEEVVVGDILKIKPGEKIPVDGVISEGASAVDESMVTGEPMPVDKSAGDTVIGGTINKQGVLHVSAAKVGDETILAQIIKLVENAQGSQAPIQNLADRISAIFVPVVLVLAVLTLVIWWTVGSYFLGFTTAFSLGLLSFVGILVIACPCALGLATPTAIIVGVGKGAEHGILVKDAENLQKLASVDTVVFDKTGTITAGTPQVTEVIALAAAWRSERIVQTAASVEQNSQHPLAQAIVSYAQKHQLSLSSVTEFVETEGVGVQGVLHKHKIWIRKPNSTDKKNQNIQTLAEQGKTVVVVEIDAKPVGLLAISDVIKPQAVTTINSLKKMGIEPILLTGDNAAAAHYIANQAGISTVHAEVLPQDKAQVITDLKQQNKKVAMVGDGINDAPALALADVGIAMGAGTDVAIETAGITVLRSDIALVPQAITLARATMRTIKQNLFWAFAYNIILIPIAMGVLYPVWGIVLNPIFAGAAMAISSVTVVTNALRLQRARLQ